MKVILDTNIWISFLLGKRLTILRELVEMEEVEIYVSEALLTELRDVVFAEVFGQDRIPIHSEPFRADQRQVQNNRGLS